MNSKKQFLGFYLIGNGDAKKMTYKKEPFTIKELASGFIDKSDNEEGGVSCMNGRVNIRPKFQRSSIRETDYEWQGNLIQSILNDKPIGTMYFGNAKGIDSDFDFINIDGQQRLITICNFVNNKTPLTALIDGKQTQVSFSDLSKEWREKIEKYEVDVNVCDGSEEEMLKWFRTINEPHSILTAQELRNSAYCGPWVESAKRYFSTTKKNAALKEITDEYNPYCAFRYTIGKEAYRQEILEVALDWASIRDYPNEDDVDTRINQYMLKHKHDKDANELIDSYKEVIDWARKLYEDGDSMSEKVVKKVNWGILYNTYHSQWNTDEKLDTAKRQIYTFIHDSELLESPGVFEYVLSGCNPNKLSLLNVRKFDKHDSRTMYNLQGGIDPTDNKHYNFEDMHAHHIIPWSLGGETTIENGVMLFKGNHSKLHAECSFSGEELKKRRDEVIKKNKNTK